MPTRLAFALFVLLALPCAGQSNIEARLNQQIDQHQMRISQVVLAPALDVKTARLQVLHQDASVLLALGTAVQTDLRRLQNGLLAKDLENNLKKLEKLSKKVRREMQ